MRVRTLNRRERQRPGHRRPAAGRLRAGDPGARQRIRTTRPAATETATARASEGRRRTKRARAGTKERGRAARRPTGGSTVAAARSRSRCPIALPGNTFEPEFGDVREDRVVLYGAADTEVKELKYAVKATNVGTYTTAPVQATALYDSTVVARGVAGRDHRRAAPRSRRCLHSLSRLPPRWLRRRQRRRATAARPDLAPLGRRLLRRSCGSVALGGWVGWLPHPPLRSRIPLSTAVTARDGRLLRLTAGSRRPVPPLDAARGDLAAAGGGDVALRGSPLSSPPGRQPRRAGAGGARHLRRRHASHRRLDADDAARAAPVVDLVANAIGKAGPDPARAGARRALFEARLARGLPEPRPLRRQHRRRRRGQRDLLRQACRRADAGRGADPGRRPAKPAPPRLGRRHPVGRVAVGRVG